MTFQEMGREQDLTLGLTRGLEPLSNWVPQNSLNPVKGGAEQWQRDAFGGNPLPHLESRSKVYKY